MVRGLNPRRYFSPEAHSELTASIRANGIIQKIVVRPKPNTEDYEIVAGERRHRAAVAAWGPDAEIAVTLRDLTDEQALLVAIEENEQRDDPSETEQADAAKRLLDMLVGNRAEAARRLGWPRSKFERRMALTKLSPDVKDALDERRIMLGHAELLAAVPFDKQNRALTTIVDRTLTVTQTRELLGRLTHSLAEAKFDRSECQTCPFNSASQRALFETCVDDGLCTNPSCYETKTQQHQLLIEAKAKAKAEAEAEEDKKATEAAAAAAAAKASAEGAPPRPATKQAYATPSSISTGPKQKDEEVEAKGEQTQDSEASKLQAAPAQNAEVQSVSPASLETNPDRAPADNTDDDLAKLREQIRRKTRPTREDTWRTATAHSVMGEPDKADAVILTAAFQGDLNEIDKNTLASRADKFMGKDFQAAKSNERLAVVANLDEAVRLRARAALATSYVQATRSFANVESIALFYGADIADHWEVTPQFLSSYTKIEIRLIAIECGAAAKVGPKAFAKMANGKVGDFVKALFSISDFDWSRRVPSSMSLDGNVHVPDTVDCRAGHPDRQAGTL